MSKVLFNRKVQFPAAETRRLVFETLHEENNIQRVQVFQSPQVPLKSPLPATICRMRVTIPSPTLKE